MRQLKRVALLFWLSLKSFMKPAQLLIFLLLAPASLGLIAGLGNRANLASEIQVAVVDQLEDEDSLDMIDYFRSNHWDILVTDHETAEQWLRHGEVKAIITIKPELKDYLAGDKRVKYVDVEQSEASLIQLTIMMTITAYGDSEQLVREFEDELADLAEKAGQDSEEVREQYQELMAAYQSGLAIDPVIFENRAVRPRQTVLVGDYSLLLLYLAVALVGQLSLIDRPILRLLTVPAAYRVDFMSLYAVNFVFGLAQAMSYSLAMSWTAGRPLTKTNLLILIVYLLTILALSLWLLLLPSDTRLFCGLLLTFMFALVGGVLFPLPGNAMVRLGQFTPLGWAMAALSGLDTCLTKLGVLAISLLLTLLAALAVKEQGRRKSRV